MLISGFGWSSPLHKLITHQLHICILLCLTYCLGPHDSERCNAGPPHSLETLQEFFANLFSSFRSDFWISPFSRSPNLFFKVFNLWVCQAEKYACSLYYGRQTFGNHNHVLSLGTPVTIEGFALLMPFA